MSITLTGKIAVITGASRGIGLGIAERFAAAGSTLHLIADDEKVLAAAEKLGASAAVADIADAEKVTEALSGLSRIDILINNAGLERLTPVAEGAEDMEALFRRIIEVNVIGTHLVTRRAVKLMGRGSSIVNTASVWGRVAEPLFGAYVASKHAVIGLTKTWAKELGSKGIRVNAVCPGWVRTESSMRSLAHMAKRSQVDEEELLQEIVGKQAFGGLMEPADVAALYLFLASELSQDITGQSIGVDRGEVPW
ncbi:MAG: SDR family NAD(P)-dependent oxidoreductase [Aestuariivirgaceae bacterium]